MCSLDAVSERFIATYNQPSYANTADAVEDYYRVQQAIADDPEAGRVKLGRRLELPPGRVRGWMNGRKPDAVNGLETLYSNEWLPESVTDDTLQSLNVLVAAVMSGGSIHRDYRPSWTDESEGRDRLESALEELGVQYEIVHTDASSRATEIRPSSDASVLGRLLIALGAPQGVKNTESGISLPWYLDDAPQEMRRAFAEAYLLTRGHQHEDKRTVSLFETRGIGFRRELAALIRDVTGENATPGERFVTVSGGAADDLLDRN